VSTGLASSLRPLGGFTPSCRSVRPAGTACARTRFPRPHWVRPSCHQKTAYTGVLVVVVEIRTGLFCNCDPGNRVDPTGCWSMVEILVTIGIILNIAGFLLHAYGAFEERASGNNLAADEDEVWAMIDLLFLAIPGSGLAAQGLKFAGEAAETATGLLEAGVNVSAVWGYLTAFLSVADGGGGGGRYGGGGSSDSPANSNGPGNWEPENNSGRSQHAIDYEKQITGHEGEAYNVNGVKFDGYDEGRGVLLEAKDHYSFLLKDDNSWKSWFDEEKLADQAEDQAKVAGNHPIEWHCSEKEVADALRNLIGKKVNVIYTPPNF
jgi:hypothetical protein